MTSWERKRVGKWLVGAGIPFVLLVLTWAFLMFFYAYPPSLEQQLEQIHRDPNTYQLIFVNASLICIPLVIIMVALGLYIQNREETKILRLSGIVSLGMYAVLVSIAYVSQYTVFIRELVNFWPASKQTAVAWYFTNPSSVPYFLDMLGYLAFGLSGIAIGYGLIREKGMERVVGGFLWASAIFAMVGFGGYALRIPVVEAGVIVGGFLSLLFGGVVLAWGLRLIKS